MLHSRYCNEQFGGKKTIKFTGREEKQLALLKAGDKKSVHNANKALETLVREARKVRKERTEDIQKAQEVISLMDEIINVCDEHRQK